MESTKGSAAVERGKRNCQGTNTPANRAALRWSGGRLVLGTSDGPRHGRARPPRRARVGEGAARGGGAVYRLGWQDGRWRCDCPALGTCSHLHALWAVTVRESA
jgi:hypothetical protein